MLADDRPLPTQLPLWQETPRMMDPTDDAAAELTTLDGGMPSDYRTLAPHDCTQPGLAVQ
jgi:hypothetical protein